jgi:hypothetical protein
VLESALHVTSATAGQCFAVYGAAPALNALTSQALPAEEQQLLGLMPSSALQHQVSAEALDDRKGLAACLATPAEPVEELESEARVATSSARRAARLAAADAAGAERARWAPQWLLVAAGGRWLAASLLYTCIGAKMARLIHCVDIPTYPLPILPPPDRVVLKPRTAVWPAQQLVVAEFEAASTATRRHKRRVLLGVVRARRQLMALVASLAPGAAPGAEA